ncbi:RHS repeat protein, partial [Stenotrophomonas maltophilia]|nr:RHS repeat protein [Stenotrophomonas maltophilia]MCU1041812.1 RHS repeat protein [Stenotrophomonas maltophilia]MCU1151802.1 RHS repeat protein [Stenotrophomonas maltophilia]
MRSAQVVPLGVLVLVPCVSHIADSPDRDLDYALILFRWSEAIALCSVPRANYDCDTLGRLTQTQDGATGTPIETYAYDATGNRTALTTSAG